jgi:HK97 family phage major capsid protein
MEAFRTYLKKYERGLSHEQRALMMDQDTQGGFYVAPEQFSTEFIRELHNETWALTYCKVVPCENSASLGTAALVDEVDDAEWTSELKTGTADSGMEFGKRELHPHPLAKRILVSKKLRRARVNIDEIVRSSLAYKIAQPIENAFFTGTGVNQALGCMTASDMGISTGRDVSTGNTTTAIKADNLIEVKYNLKPQYRKNARWFFHRDAIKKIRMLKDGDGSYIWKAGISSDRPDTILEMAFTESEYMPNTFTSGQYVGILGNFDFFWWAVSLRMEVQLIDQLYAETNQDLFIVRAELDGQPMLESAFVRVQLAS